MNFFRLQKIVFSIFLLSLLFCAELYSEQLKEKPIFLEFGKKLGQTNYNLYFKKCGATKKFNSNLFLLTFGAHSFSQTESIIYIWEYNPKTKDFTNTPNSFRKDPCSVRNQYKLFIWTTNPPNKEIEDKILKTNYRISSHKHIGNRHQFISSLEMERLRLATSAGLFLEKDEKLCTCTYFDSEGYAYIQYPLENETCCEGTPPDKPEITYRTAPKKEFVSIENWEQSISEKKNSLPKAHKNYARPKQDVKWGSINYTYDNRFGYVHYNKSFTSSELLNDDYIMMLLPQKMSPPTFSPIKCNNNVCQYSHPNLSIVDPIIMSFDNNAGFISLPFAKLVNGRIQRLKKYAKVSKSEMKILNDLNKIQAESHNNTSESEELMHLFCRNNQQCIGAYQSLLKVDTAIIKKFGQNNYIQNNNGNHFLVSPNFRIEINNISYKHTLHDNKKHSIIEPYLHDTYKDYHVKTAWGDYFSYLKINILHSNEIFFQSIANKRFNDYSVKSNTLSSALNQFPLPLFFEKKRFGVWLIIDDYKDPAGGFHLQTFHKFKISPSFEKLLRSTNNNHYRIDRIRGNTVERIYDINEIIDNSTFRRVCEITALKNLENHRPGNHIVAWELHLLLGRIIGQSVDDVSLSKIIKKLDELKVERIVVWEFSDSIYEKSFYKNLFNKISRQRGWNFKHNQIPMESMFRDICIPLMIE